jgi:hypothetical protein
MVLRPNVLKYKGAVRRVDDAKMDAINKKM